MEQKTLTAISIKHDVEHKHYVNIQFKDNKTYRQINYLAQ